MATAAETLKRRQETKEFHVPRSAKTRQGKLSGENSARRAKVNATLRRQGILVTKISKQKFRADARYRRKTLHCSPGNWPQ